MKKAVSLLLIVSMIVTLSVTAFAQSEPSDWAVDEIDYGAERFLKDTTGKEIDYAKGITREEFAMIALYLYNAASDNDMPQISLQNPFVDCNNPLVVTAYGLGVVKGVSDNEFNPDAPVTREQICVMLVRIATMLYPKLGEEYIKVFLPSLKKFNDADTVSSWAEDAVKMAYLAEIIKGDDGGNINPLGNCTVQEALIIAKRALKLKDSDILLEN